jgi:MarR family transcriptional regulator for hemolysin
MEIKKEVIFMITKHDDLLGTLVHDVAPLLRHEIDRRLKTYNLTRVKWLALGIISKKPNLTQAELALEMELGHAAVGRLVDRLEQRQFIIRKSDTNDRRAYRIDLTDTAKDLLDHLNRTADNLRADVLNGFTIEEVSALNDGLNKIKNNLKSIATIFLMAFLLPLQKMLSLTEGSLGAV